MLEWIEQHGVILTVATGAMFVVFVGSLLLVPVIVTRIPHDYFAHHRRPPSRMAEQHRVVRIVFRVAKNVVGVLLMLAGVAMLVLPGQGLLSIFVGFLRLDFPGKYRLEKWIVSRRRALGAINWLRRRRGRAPMIVVPPDGSAPINETPTGPAPP